MDDRRMKSAPRQPEAHHANINHSLFLRARSFSISTIRFARRIARTVWLLQNAMMPSETQTATAARPGTQGVIFYLLCAGFVLNGIVICLIGPDRKSTRLNSSHGYISYAVFCLKK